MDTFSKNYLIDLNPVIRLIGDAVNEFYFYPDDIEGFIESCVLATQRDMSAEERDLSIIDDLKGAMELWTRREDDHDAMVSGTWINGQCFTRYKALNVLGPAVEIDKFVYGAMFPLYDVHGDLAIDATSFQWTRANGLIMRITY